MSGNGGEYVRVYLSIRNDPRFATIYGDNDRLATWLRLLMEADALWPALAPVPRSIHEPSLAALAEVGLIELMPLDHYRVHGLDAERQARSDHGRAAAHARWGPDARSITRRIAQPMHAEPSTAKLSRAEHRARESGVMRPQASRGSVRLGALHSLSTCPNCGDELRSGEDGVVAELGTGQLWHQQPCLAALSSLPSS